VIADDKWKTVAQRIDLFRVVPRAIVFGYYTFFAHAWYYVVTWFMHFDWAQVKGSEASALAVAAFPAAILGVLTGVLSTITKSYWESGVKWESSNAPGDPKTPDQ
jgi:hypothetical protein